MIFFVLFLGKSKITSPFSAISSSSPLHACWQQKSSFFYSIIIAIHAMCLQLANISGRRSDAIFIQHISFHFFGHNNPIMRTPPLRTMYSTIFRNMFFLGCRSREGGRERIMPLCEKFEGCTKKGWWMLTMPSSSSLISIHSHIRCVCVASYVGWGIVRFTTMP